MSKLQLEEYQQSLLMLAKMEDKFLLNVQWESEKPVHREIANYNYELQSFTNQVLKRKLADNKSC